MTRIFIQAGYLRFDISSKVDGFNIETFRKAFAGPIIFDTVHTHIKFETEKKAKTPFKTTHKVETYTKQTIYSN